MRGLLRLIMSLCLIAGLATGAAVHASGLAACCEVSPSAQWLHAESGHDPEPVDSGQAGHSHRHSACHGHDMAAPMKLGPAPCAFDAIAQPRPVADAFLPAGPPSLPLRPPIA